VGRAAVDGASAAEAQPGNDSIPSQAADGATSTADQATASGAAAPAEQQAWHAVSTLHAGGRVHRGELGTAYPPAYEPFPTVSLSEERMRLCTPAISGSCGQPVKLACPSAGTSPRWCWSEDEADVIVETAASGASSARDISVKFQPRHLALRCQLACKPSPVRKQKLGAGSSFRHHRHQRRLHAGAVCAGNRSSMGTCRTPCTPTSAAGSLVSHAVMMNSTAPQAWQCLTCPGGAANK
jgi:hypothetical protein